VVVQGAICCFDTFKSVFRCKLTICQLVKVFRCDPSYQSLNYGVYNLWNKENPLVASDLLKLNQHVDMWWLRENEISVHGFFSHCFRGVSLKQTLGDLTLGPSFLRVGFAEMVFKRCTSC
jgi:hypothetical protein